MAAILSVIKYTMNDTVVVSGRIRENVARYRDKKLDRVVNASINETLSRTILTSATVFFVTLAISILGTGSSASSASPGTWASLSAPTRPFSSPCRS